MAGRLFIKKKHSHWRPGFPEVLVDFRVYTNLGRTDTRTRDRVFFQSIRNSFRNLPRRLSKNCEFQFANSAIFKDNYSIDACPCRRSIIPSRYKKNKLLLSIFTGMAKILVGGTRPCISGAHVWSCRGQLGICERSSSQQSHGWSPRAN